MKRIRFLGEVYVTDHAAERFCSRVAPWLLPSEATQVIRRVAMSATLDRRRTHKGNPAWWVDLPACFLVTKTDVGQGGGSIVVTVLQPDMALDVPFARHDKKLWTVAEMQAREEALPDDRIQTERVVEQDALSTVDHPASDIVTQPTARRVREICEGASAMNWAEEAAVRFEQTRRGLESCLNEAEYVAPNLVPRLHAVLNGPAKMSTHYVATMRRRAE